MRRRTGLPVLLTAELLLALLLAHTPINAAAAAATTVAAAAATRSIPPAAGLQPSSSHISSTGSSTVPATTPTAAPVVVDPPPAPHLWLPCVSPYGPDLARVLDAAASSNGTHVNATVDFAYGWEISGGGGRIDVFSGTTQVGGKVFNLCREMGCPIPPGVHSLTLASEKTDAEVQVTKVLVRALLDSYESLFCVQVLSVRLEATKDNDSAYAAAAATAADGATGINSLLSPQLS